MTGDGARATRILVALWGGALLLFTLWPGLDLTVSGWFYRPGTGFPLSGKPGIEMLRNAVWDLSILVFALSLALSVFRLARRDRDGARLPGFVCLLYLLGPVLIVNGLLKQYWGRARPADVTAFGGQAEFTPFWLPSDQCLSNCSFVSGEGSAAAALAVTFAALAPAARRRLPGWGFRLYVALGIVLPAAGLALRVVTGRHFLSDTVFAVLVVLSLALVLWHMLLGDAKV